MLSATLRHTDIETHLTLHLNNAISRHNVLDTLFISTYTLVNIVCATIQKVSMLLFNWQIFGFSC